MTEIKGYVPQSAAKIDVVNIHKEAEERLLRQLDLLSTVEENDSRWLAIARSHFELGFMALNRSVFKPKRISLPEDSEEFDEAE